MPSFPFVMSSRRCAYGSIEALAGFQHRVHDDSEFARHRDRGPLEADLLPQLHSPGAKGAVGKAPRQNDGGSLIQQSPQVVVATPRDVPVKFYLARLVASWLETQPGDHRARSPEVLRSLDRCREG